MSLYYAQEKAYEVLLGLGSKDQSLAERLAAAVTGSFRDLVAEVGREQSGLHLGLVRDLVTLFDEIQSLQPENESFENISVTISALDASAVASYTEQIVLFCVETLQARGEDAWLLGTNRD